MNTAQEGQRQWTIYLALAAAHAELGNFDEAVKAFDAGAPLLEQEQDEEDHSDALIQREKLVNKQPLCFEVR